MRALDLSYKLAGSEIIIIHNNNILLFNFSSCSCWIVGGKSIGSKLKRGQTPRWRVGPHTPTINPLEIMALLEGFLNSKVYSPCPPTLETQRQMIEEEVDRIPLHQEGLARCLKPSQTQPSCSLNRMLTILRSRRSIIASLLFT